MDEPKIYLLRKVLRRNRKVLIFLHDNPDPDAIASGWALQYLLKKKFYIQSIIVYGGIIARSENRAMVDQLGIKLVPVSQIKLRPEYIYALIDTQPGVGNNSFPDTIIPHIVIDHHPLKADLEIPFIDIRTKIGATVTVMYEYLQDAQVQVNKLLATAMYYGISSETQDLGRESSESDQKAYLDLFPLTSRKILSRIIHPKNHREYFSVLARGLNNAYVNGSLGYCHLGNISSPDYIHQLADLMLTCENMRWALCTGWCNGNLFLSLRATNSRAKAGVLVRKLVGSFGQAGGHDTMAGGKLEYAGTLTPDIQTDMEDLLTKRFVRYCGYKKDAEFSKLVEVSIQSGIDENAFPPSM